MFSARIERALRVALAAHDGQLRKCAEPVPYAVHPLHVGLMLARWGQEEDVVVAGLLHDVVEDCPDWTVERVARDFGAHVAGVVGELSEDKSRSWDERKRDGVERVAGMSPEAAAVKAADKLHNLATLKLELEASTDPDALWARFKGGRDNTLRMSSELVEALAQRVEPKIARALRAALQALLDQVAATSKAGVGHSA